TPEGHIYGVDHGVCFSVEDKLRTLLWRWRGKRLTEEAIDVLSGLRAQLEGELGSALMQLLDREEVLTTVDRVDRLLATRRHPMPSDGWPPVPWPPF
ncbi:MAG TPA: phosphatidylinositol kinase, partial [Mycobacteriales bacterium]|nr:phosphatidylinositol kinase [Mycobacteriales bacterium]